MNAMWPLRCFWRGFKIKNHTFRSVMRSAHSEPWEKPELTTFRNGNKAKGTFSKSEMNRRISKLRTVMNTDNIDGILLTSHHNINYYSDYLYCSVGRQYGLVVTKDNVLSISALVDGGYAWRSTAIGDNLVYTDWHRDNFYKAVKQALGQFKGNIGCEFDHINFESYTKLKGTLPECTLVDVGKSTMHLRLIKSEEEIAHIKEGARIADIGGGAVVEALQENAGEHEVALHATQVMVKEIAKSRPHIGLQDSWTWLQTGVNSDGAHNPVTSRRVQKGDICLFNCFPMMGGYFGALERTAFLDHASDESLRIWNANCEVFEAGMKLVKPGIKCSEIAHQLNKIYAKHNLLDRRTFGYGHSFGVMCHYYGREPALELREDIDTILMPNMVLTMEPMVLIPEGEPGAGGYREHNVLVVTENGAENITHFPYGPEHLIVKK